MMKINPLIKSSKMNNLYTLINYSECEDVFLKSKKPMQPIADYAFLQKMKKEHYFMAIKKKILLPLNRRSKLANLILKQNL